MAYDIGPRIGIEGEKEFRDAISKINTNLKTLDTEMAKVVSQYEKGDKSAAALTSQNDVLNKKIDEQKKKLADLEKYLDAAKEKYGDNSAETQRLQQATNKATTELNLMERELKDNNAAIEQANRKTGELGDGQEALGKKTRGLGDALDGVAGKLGISIPDGAKNALNSMATVDMGMVGLAGAAVGAAVAVVKVIDALAEMAKQQAAVADEMLTQEKITGVSAKTLQEFAYASELVDVDLDTLTGSLTKLTNTMDTARKGNKDTADAYERLGVSITNSNGTLRDAEAVFWNVIDALRKIEDHTERDALAMDIMGKSAQDLNPLIEIGSQGFATYAQRAHEAGYVLSGEMLAALGAYDDAIQESNNSTEALEKNVSTQMAPALTELTNAFSNFKQGLTDISTLAHVFDPILYAATDLLNVLILLREGIQYITSAQGSVQQMASAYRINSIYSQWESRPTIDLWSTTTEGIGRNANGTDYWRGGLTWVGERGPELIQLPQATRIFSTEESAGISSRMAAMQMMSTTYGGDTFVFHPGAIVIDPKNVREFNDVVRMAQDARQSQRAGRR